MARLYTDEHFPLSVTLHLRKLGHDLLTTQEAGMLTSGSLTKVY